MLKCIVRVISAEKVNIRYWNIILYAIGILTGFFSNNFEKIILFLVLFLISIFILTFGQENKKYLFFSLLFFVIGLTSSTIKVLITNKIEYNFGTREAVFDGKIENIHLSSNFSYITLTALNPPNTMLKNQKIKLKYNGNVKDLAVGDIVNIKTSLSTIKYNYFPNDKSYENYAKYFGIVARGKIKELTKISNTTDKLSVDKIRRKIQERIYNVNNGSVGSGIVIDILTGNNSFIPRDKLNNIRHSGCAHILAISGLHMSVIIAFVFFIFIHIFALFPKIALKYNTKKLASIPACLTCLIYLQIANVPISALRSFLMVFCGFLALLSNRHKSSMNIFFITFFLILLTAPQDILSPSFQMSFMAVFGLISVYNSEFLTQTTRNITNYRFVRYIIGIFSSSIIATISTIFFEIYHFKQYAWIGLISNIFVIPLTEFVILPLGFIGMICNGTLIGDAFYKASSFFAEYICKITDYTASLYHSFLIVPQMQLYQLGIIILGLIMVFLCRNFILKIVGCFVSICGLYLYIIQPQVVLVYNQNLKNIVFLEDNVYYSVEPIKNNYVYNVWCQNLGVREIKVMTNKNKNISCSFEIKNNIKFTTSCKYNFKNKEYIFYKKNNDKISIFYDK